MTEVNLSDDLTDVICPEHGRLLRVIIGARVLCNQRKKWIRARSFPFFMSQWIKQTSGLSYSRASNTMWIQHSLPKTRHIRRIAMGYL
jgi:hypothetical protein